jgi:GxxExxY protein
MKKLTTENTELTERKTMIEHENQLTEKIIGAGIRVHRELGPGLLESTYEACLVYELRDQGLFVEPQKELPVIYRGLQIDCGYRLDLLVEKQVIVELKAVDQIHPIHQARLLTYMKLSRLQISLLMNFNVKVLKDGIKRFVL